MDLGGNTAPDSEDTEKAAALESIRAREQIVCTRSSVLDSMHKALRDDVFRIYSKGASASESAAVGGSSGRKAGGSAAAGPKGTPIIVVPGHATATINMFNVEDLLVNQKYVPPAEARAAAMKAGQPKPSRVTIRRKLGNGDTCQYYIIDDVTSLRRHDWYKVAAVFAAGPEWQFKDWGKTNENYTTPVQIFDRSLGFYLGFHGEDAPPTIPKWNVTQLLLHRGRAYMDTVVVNRFWELLDKHIQVSKPYLYRVVQETAQ
jgi:hypothetical protein